VAGARCSNGRSIRQPGASIRRQEVDLPAWEQCLHHPPCRRVGAWRGAQRPRSRRGHGMPPGGRTRRRRRVGRGPATRLQLCPPTERQEARSAGGLGARPRRRGSSTATAFSTAAPSPAATSLSADAASSNKSRRRCPSRWSPCNFSPRPATARLAYCAPATASRAMGKREGGAARGAGGATFVGSLPPQPRQRAHFAAAPCQELFCAPVW
jgi:hypothetical protein